MRRRVQRLRGLRRRFDAGPADSSSRDPRFVKLVDILTQVVTAIAKFFGMLSGKSWGAQVAAAKGLNAEKKQSRG